VRVLVIGLDGVDWNVIDHMAHKGVLTTIPALAERGRWAILRSTIPPITVTAWASFATGSNPGKHGCFSFLLPGRSLAEKRPISSRDMKVKTFYEILEENGRKCVLINLPLSYPPRIRSGIVITSILTRGDNFVFPRNILLKVPEFRKYRLVPNSSLYIMGRTADYVRDVRNLERVRFRCAMKLMRLVDWDLFFVLFSGTDWIHHVAYDKIFAKSTEEAVRREIYGFYKELDTYIELMIKNVPSDTLVIVMSDHGFKTYRGLFSLNAWLSKRGLLKQELTAPSTYSHLVEESVGRKATIRWMSRLSAMTLSKLCNKIDIGSQLLLFIASKISPIMPMLSHLKLETRPLIDETIAYTPDMNSHGIYINLMGKFVDGIVNPSEYEDIRNEIIGELKGMREPRGRKTLFKAVLRKEDVYRGGELDRAPDILVVPRNYSVEWNNPLVILRERPFNFHNLHGILIMYGSRGCDVKYNVENDSTVDIYDVAPTILTALGVEKPRYMDGRTLIHL